MIVVFRLLDAYDQPGAFIPIKIALSHLSYYRIGTIWQKGKCVSDIALSSIAPQRVDFTEHTGWVHTSRYEARKLDLPQSFLNTDYPLLYKDNDKCWLLDFKLADNKNMLVPCVEFLVRAYARNSDVCRALTALEWDEVFSVFYENTSPSETEWLVRPSRHMRDGDAVYLAHLMYDPYTSHQSRLINSQVLSADPKKPVLLKVAPWFKGPAEIEGRGLWINGGETFLCLDITGCSLPPGREIVWERLQFDTDQGVDGTGRSVMPRPVKTAKADEFIAAVDDREPDNHSETTIVKSAPFKQLGAPRKVTKSKHTVSANTGRRGPKPPEATSHSTGCGAGSGKQTGKLQLVADAPLESHGVLRDIWRALHDIAASNAQISDLHWYTPSEGFNAKDEPMLITLSPHMDDQLPGKTLNWVYIDSKTKQLRGVLMIRIKIAGTNYFLIELQRKKTGVEEKEESFAGVLFLSHLLNRDELNDFIEAFCSRIRFRHGVVRDLKSLFPNDTKFFNHRLHEETVLYRRVLINAFRDVGVSLT
ncbi:hypothetical protein [Pseudomonas sp. S3_E10]